MHKLKSDYITLSSNNRLYGVKKPIIGLTGGIGSGKTTVSKILQTKDIPLVDADALVKTIYQEQDTIKFIETSYPKVVANNEIDFLKLRELFFNSTSVKEHISNHIYLKLPKAFLNTIKTLDFSQFDFLIYDVPLLFEKNLESKLDLTCLVYCPRETQQERVILRDKISKELANQILDQQMNIEEKRLKSDLIINNINDLDYLNEQVEIFLEHLLE